MASTSTQKNSTMSDIAKYKKILMEKLNVNEDTIDKMFKSTLYSFKNQLEKLGQSSFIESLMKLEYKEMVEFKEDDDDFNTIKDDNDIHDVNVKPNKDCFVCLCGKQHLKNLHLFSHSNIDGKCLVIGSSCINQVEKIKKAYADNKELVKKLEKINGQIKNAEKLAKIKKDLKPCYRCGDMCLKKSSKTTHPHKKNYCVKCLVGKQKNFIKCNSCYIKVIPASKPLPFGNGFQEICSPCWHKKNADKDWYKKKYKK
jgi:hypothetical protein